MKREKPSKPKKIKEPKPPKQKKEKKPLLQSFTPKRWHRLDNTANLFPVITSRRFSNVYRISLNLYEPVLPELLQQALEKTLNWFPAFKVRMRRGVFWRYLEENMATPIIYLEDDYPCRYIDPGQNNQYLFRVSYFEKRITLEVFHVLSDGTGGLQFLQALCCQYLILAHPDRFSDEEKERHWFVQHAANTEDSYVANYTPTKKANYREGRAYRLKGDLNPMDALSVTNLYIPVKPALQMCREKGVSLTHYITACIGWAVYTQNMAGKASKYPVNIFLPVNLRNLFPSTTTLNFFSNIYVSLFFNKPGLTFDDVLQEVKLQFEQKVTRENMLEKISYTVGSGYSWLVRAVPLPLKNIALRAIFEASAKSSTMGFSNMGKVDMPPAFSPFVSGAVLMLSSAPREPLKAAAISYGEVLTLTLTSLLRGMDIQRAVARQMAADGLELTIETNGVDYETM